MGEQKVNTKSDHQARIEFLRHLMEDLKSLEYMFEKKMIEDDIVRIGAEQEFCLVNEYWRPAKNALEVLEAINDSHFTTELARFNLEINLDPIELKTDAFKKVENQLKSLLEKAKTAANNNNTKILLTGILPSISKHELDLEFMTPFDRYYALNEVLKKAKGENFRMNFAGVDDLPIMHNSVMFEACNTSFQMHLQIAPDDFASSYNWAQTIAGPVLGACVNSPLLLGKELWSETRIALFQQSIDTRRVSLAQTEQQSRVTFGNSWFTGTIVDFYKHEISKFRTLLTKEIKSSSFDELKAGKIPKLTALNLHNGTIYRWNRPCYGVGNGKPHVRIENRYIPSGPTATDEMANFAFWVGLMKGRPTEFDDIPRTLDFEDVKSNFIRAARTGTESIMNWRGKLIPLDQLVLEVLLPISKIGLERMKIDNDDIDKYLDVIRDRLLKSTGSQWMVTNYRYLKKQLKPDDALIALTSTLHTNQESYDKVSEWPNLQSIKFFNSTATKVGHLMTSTLITAKTSDLGLLTLNYMKWNTIHHLPVVNNDGTLVGLITWQHLKQFWDQVQDANNSISAREIMITDVFTAQTSTPLNKAIALMKKHKIGCLPVLQETQLVGILTLKDLIHVYNA
ncbi:CBS domain-containing protein [Formosa sp. Hel1_33_131]|uniref:CBS domain-containing protein n=1 Tax=Formosa sp. Hel1_33_131 TaxID=1336794 RepID=UPI00084E1F98|nr:CBS domain-containing protein [Formosa sp. Hel1_33_131]